MFALGVSPPIATATERKMREEENRFQQDFTAGRLNHRTTKGTQHDDDLASS